MSAAPLLETLDDYTWLYRGVPAESPEVGDVESIGEIRPPRRDRVGDYWRHVHVCGMTDTGYTSWSTDRSIAEAAASDSGDNNRLSGQIQIFRVRIATLDPERVFEGRGDEEEFLIEGTVEDVKFSEDPADAEDD